MSQQRIILANGSRLMREMLNRALLRADHLKVVKEIADHRDLPSNIEPYDAEWVIMSLPIDSKVPKWVDTYMAEHPLVRFIAVSIDGSQVKMKWLESHEEDYDDLSLDELIHILEGRPRHA